MLPLLGPPTVTTVAMASASTMVTSGTTIASWMLLTRAVMNVSSWNSLVKLSSPMKLYDGEKPFQSVIAKYNAWPNG